MDTNNTPEDDTLANPSRHRHLVALPAFAFFLTITVLSSRIAASIAIPDATGLPPGDARSIVRLAGDIEGVAASGTVMGGSGELADLKSGSLLLTHPGLFGITMGDLTCYGFHGGFVLTRTDRESTVAAISSPVLVVQGQMREIVPVGMQWTLPVGTQLQPLSSGPTQWSDVRKLSDLPPDFLKSEREDLSRLKLPELLPVATDTTPGAQPILSDTLLPEARDHSFTEWQTSVIAALRGAAASSKIDALKSMLTDQSLAPAFAADKGRALLALILAETPSSKVEVQMALSEPLIQDERLWLLLSYHPDFQAVAWTFDRLDLPRESVITRLFLLPFADASTEGVPAVAYARFETGFHEVLGAMEEPESMLKFLVTSYAPQIDRLDALGYPLRSDALGKTLIDLLTPYAATYSQVADAVESLKTHLGRSTIAVPQDVSADLLRRSEEHSVSSVTSSSVASVESSSSSSMPALSPAEVERRAHILLHSAEAVYTLKTEVKADAPDQAKISDVVFGSSSGDHTVNFTLDVVTEIVTGISIDGKSDFPFTPRFDAFTRWLKK